MNMASTRSHCIFTIHITSREPGSDKIRKAKLHLVDLAGLVHTNSSNEHKCFHLLLEGVCVQSTRDSERRSYIFKHTYIFHPSAYCLNLQLRENWKDWCGWDTPHRSKIHQLLTSLLGTGWCLGPQQSMEATTCMCVI